MVAAYDLGTRSPQVQRQGSVRRADELMRVKIVVALLAACIAGGAATVAAPAPVAVAVAVADGPATRQVDGDGAYRPLLQQRIYDSRQSHDVFLPQQTRSLTIRGRGGVNSTATSVVLNVTVANASTGGYLTIWPMHQPRPTASSINFPASSTTRAAVANLITVPLAPNGAISIYNAAGNAHVILDVVGYYGPLGIGPNDTFQEVYPQRLTDTRTWGLGALQPGDYAYRAVSYSLDGVDWSPHISALAVNITAVSPSNTGGSLAAWPNSGAPPSSVSTLNLVRGRSASNMAIVPTSPCGQCTDGYEGKPSIKVANNSGAPVHVLIDIVGIYASASLDGGWYFKPASAPTRIVDTRSGLGTTRFAGDATRAIDADAVSGDPTYALVTNTTLVRPTGNTYLTLWPKWPPDIDFPQPGTSNVNAVAGSIVASHTITPVGPGNVVNIHNAGGYADVLVDVVGTLENVSGVAQAQPMEGGGVARRDGATSAGLGR